jgi:thiol-disulfide isomerase/thioredoxin
VKEPIVSNRMSLDRTAMPSRRSLLAAGASLGLAAAPGASAQSFGSFFPRASGMPELSGAVAWLNTEPLTWQALRGRVVLVQFWTFTCVNWLRTLPYVGAWAAKYKDKGLVVLGVHTPEFGFEEDVTAVREAAAQLRVTYPVAVDSRRAVWTAFRNSAWPALYVVDAQGMVRFQHDGEGEYATAEKWVQRLLADAGAKEVPGGLVQPDARGVQVGADWAQLRSPETYTGAQKADRFASPGGIAPGRSKAYVLPGRLPGNTWGVEGAWTFAAEAARTEMANGKLVYRFQARDVNLVMGAARRDRPVPYRVRIDGQVPGPAHGSDVDAGGRGVLAEARLYQLVRQPGSVRERTFEIEFLEAGAEVFAFTFG